MSIPIQYLKHTKSAEAIVAAVERAVSEQALSPGDRLPTVRELADQQAISPSTVAAAYRTLAGRGIVTGRGRQGTRISAGPALPHRPPPVVPAGVRNLAAGNPDPALLPALQPVLRRLDPIRVSYGDDEADLPELARLAIAQLRADGIPAARVLTVSGALDGVERVLLAHLRPGDRVAVEDPGYPRVFDLLAALGLVALPVALDEHGMLPAALSVALDDGAVAVIVTPRAQNPTGAAFDDRRALELRKLLRRHPTVLTIEDDHAGPVAGTPAHTLADESKQRWAVVRSVAKSLGPDLRVAMLTGDRTTLDRVEGRLRLGAGWVSHVLQAIVVDLWSTPKTATQIQRARDTYGQRRGALVEALAEHGIGATGRSGLNVWVPVAAEDAVIAGLAQRGWAVAGGERFRLRTPPAVRITVASLEPADAAQVAADLAAVLAPSTRRPTISA